MKRVLITGATGFVGVNLAEKLIKEGHEVHVVVRSGYKSWRIEHLLPHLNLHVLDLLDRDRLFTAIAQIKPDWVFHLAAFGGYSWQDEPIQAINTNYIATVNLLDACLNAGFEVFINTGSCSEYGVKEHAPAEGDHIDPRSYYAVTKAAATLFCRYAAQRFNRPIFTLRLYSVYGAFEEPPRLIPSVIMKGLKGGYPTLSAPETARDFVYTEDVVSAYLLVARIGHALPPGEIYNVGSGNQTSIHDVVSVARSVFGQELDPVWGSMPNRQGDSSICVAENLKLRSIGWVPRFSFKDGFQLTVGWFQQNPSLIDRVYR